ncbi:MAG: hypothetical protein WCR42_11225 [bacterium]
MYKLKDLKKRIIITDTKVECPQKTCNRMVERQRKTFRKSPEFYCSNCQIYISPSTFEYNSESDNLLWFNPLDQDLFEKINKVKRESRISRDNSEDAVTWNVFRYFDRNKILSDFLSKISNDVHNVIELMLWSYSPNEFKGWSWLNKARLEFGETIVRGSEPDIIILTDTTLFFIEAKFNAGNNTVPSAPDNKKEYTIGGQNWFGQVFKSDYQTIAITNKKYELMRFWLLGCWIAKKLNVKFQLVNLVLDNKETNIVSDFGKHIVVDSNNTFSRLTWEEIYSLIKNSHRNDNDTLTILDYFENKAAGYNSKGDLKKAFITN